MKTKYSCIIVDDEPHARFRLKLLLEQTQQFDILAEARDGNEACELINSLNPEVVFLDIQMPGTDGFQVLEHITYDPFIIFCTAFNQYALKAFETYSIDYLLKPVELPRLIKTIEKLHKLSEKLSIIRQMRSEFHRNEQEQKANIIPVKIGDRLILVPVDTICYFEAKDKSVHFFDGNGKEYFTDHSLQTLENKLPDFFVRVSRSVIVNRNSILECRKYFKGKYVLLLKDKPGSKIISGSSFSMQMKQITDFWN